MKTYQSSTNERRRNFFVRHKNALIAIAAVLVIATVITLSIVLTLPKRGEPVETPPPDDTQNPPVVTEPKIVLPMTGDTGLSYAQDKLVYWETLELWRTHPAVDFMGEGDVSAVLDGTVKSVDMHTVLDGNVVTIEHDNGYISVYKSLGDEITVKVGDEVKAGTKIGVASDSMLSELESGAHLHLEMKKDGAYVDPATVLPLSQDK